MQYCIGFSFYGSVENGPLRRGAWNHLISGDQRACCCFYDAENKLGIRLHSQDFRPERSVMGQILRIGAPIALQDGLIQVAFVIITIIANKRGLSDAAAVGIVEKVISFLFLVPSSMLSTVSALGAQNIGAGKYDRARKVLRYGIMIAAGFGVIVSVLIQFAAVPVVGLFTTDAAVRTAGGQYLRGYIWDCILQGSISASAVISVPVEGQNFPFAQYHRHRVRADPGSLFDIHALSRYTVAHGTCNGLRLAFICSDLFGCLLCLWSRSQSFAKADPGSGTKDRSQAHAD